MYLNKNEIPKGDAKEDKKQRKKFIKDFYRLWETKTTNKIRETPIKSLAVNL